MPGPPGMAPEQQNVFAQIVVELMTFFGDTYKGRVTKPIMMTFFVRLLQSGTVSPLRSRGGVRQKGSVKK